MRSRRVVRGDAWSPGRNGPVNLRATPPARPRLRERRRRGSERGTRYCALAPLPLCANCGRRDVYLHKRQSWFRAGYPLFHPSTPPPLHQLRTAGRLPAQTSGMVPSGVPVIPP